MDVVRMHDMIETLSECAKREFEKGIENIDTCEMGEVIDMLKDLSEAMYYRTVTKGMEEYGGIKRGFIGPPYYHQMPEDYHKWDSMPEAERMRDLDREKFGRMFFTEPEKMKSHDEREGRAGESRRSYIETKELHSGDSTADKDAKMKELEKYMKSLSEDVTELFAGMSPEEKELTKRKLTTLVTKM